MLEGIQITIRQLGFAVPYAAVFTRYAVPTVLAVAMLIVGRLFAAAGAIAANVLITLSALALFALGRVLVAKVGARRVEVPQ